MMLYACARDGWSKQNDSHHYFWDKTVEKCKKENLENVQSKAIPRSSGRGLKMTSLFLCQFGFLGRLMLQPMPISQ